MQGRNGLQPLPSEHGSRGDFWEVFEFKPHFLFSCDFEQQLFISVVFFILSFPLGMIKTGGIADIKHKVNNMNEANFI
jgi:hypothetical protein